MTAVVQRWNQVAGIRSIRLGDLRVSYVPDGAVRLKPRGWFPESTAQDWRERTEHLDETGSLVASIGALLVEHGDRAMLIDAGYGPSHQPDDPSNEIIGELRAGELIDNLARLGRRPHEIESVAITHLHTDHIGWACRPGVFPGARYLISEPEWTLRDQHAADVSDEMLERLAHQVVPVADGEEVFPGVRVRLSPGHTPGHASFVVTSKQRRLIVLGDALHNAVQIAQPTWPVRIDVDREQAIRSRQELVAELLEPDTLGFGGHFADVVFGRAVRDGGTARWSPEL
ncbi:MBL fold metallo-hydrolase [Saccharopolyspora taberi]|uniref:MBL fold metallo-hydrolase n=1 Tax=Saccharopolyspora taberi TaxID=60895 RepID=A0ABN3VCI5_9PSEU